MLSAIYFYYNYYLEIFIKIVLSVLLGGFIGFNRENLHRPAGFRTHILVCVGAALIMMISEHLYRTYHGLVNLDPARLGAQVISGIGFLGAGTIIKEGETVKGLTTAASLWAVSCIGLAIGAGFYVGGIITAITIYVVLITFKKIYFGGFGKQGKLSGILHLRLYKDDGEISKLEEMLRRSNVHIKWIKVLYENETEFVIKLSLRYSGLNQYQQTIDLIKQQKGIIILNDKG